MIARNLRKIFSKFRHTPFHPQWNVFKNDHQKHRIVRQWSRGKVLDIGCADQTINSHIPQASSYIGLDYYSTATEWYQTRPHVFGDAQKLPFASESMDSVLLLDVLEHLPSPGDCLAEIVRVLKPAGILILQVPCLYPIHDAPLDFHRWTKYGLRQAVSQYGLEIVSENYSGSPLETGGMLLNIALCKHLLNWYRQKNPALLLTPFIIATVVLVNILSWLLTIISPDDDMMPHGYCFILEKSVCDISS